MNKTELIAAIAEKAGLTKKDAERVLNAAIDSIPASLVAGDKVQLVGFGTFEVKKKMERISVNPTTGKRYLIPPKLVLGFKQSNVLKDKFNAE